MKKANAAPVTQEGEALVKKLTTIEVDLYQVLNHASEDALNFPIKINNRLAALEGIVEGADAKPTAQSYTIFTDEKAVLDKYMTNLDSVLQTDLAAFNKTLAGHNLPPVTTK